MKKNCLLIALFIQVALQAQTFAGTLTDHRLQEMTLEGFDNYDTVELGKARADSLGNFSLDYPKDYTGMALLKTENQNNLVLLLGGDRVRVQGTHITETDKMVFNKSQNKTFFSYAMEQSNRRNALNAWKYLDKLYGKSKTFEEQIKIKKAITEEIQRLKNREQTLMNGLPKESYLRWFIPYRTFLQEMPTIIRTETERIPESITLFRTTDFNHPNWASSGILQEFIEKHYFMLENSAGTAAEKQEKMNQSSRYLIENLYTNPLVLNLVVEKLFNFLEERSLYIASEFLATQVLNGAQCEIQEKTANKLEKYRNLKVGSKAPDIQLSTTQKLSDYNGPLLLVFGKSDCSHCREEAIELLKYHEEWKREKKTEVVYISLDTDKETFAQAYQNAPWSTFCDFKGWKSKAAMDYHVWGTPSYFLLDKDMTILAHINSVEHAKVWIDTMVAPQHRQDE